MLETDGALGGTVYNVGTQEEVSIIELVESIANKMNRSDYKINFEGYRKSDPVRRLLNTDKIFDMTNWKPKISLEEGLEMCIKTKVTNE